MKIYVSTLNLDTLERQRVAPVSVNDGDNLDLNFKKQRKLVDEILIKKNRGNLYLDVKYSRNSKQAVDLSAAAKRLRTRRGGVDLAELDRKLDRILETDDLSIPQKKKKISYRQRRKAKYRKKNS